MPKMTSYTHNQGTHDSSGESTRCDTWTHVRGCVAAHAQAGTRNRTAAPQARDITAQHKTMHAHCTDAAQRRRRGEGVERCTHTLMGAR